MLFMQMQHTTSDEEGGDDIEVSDHIEQRRKERQKHIPSEAGCHLGVALRELEGEAAAFHRIAELYRCRVLLSPGLLLKLTCVGLF